MWRMCGCTHDIVCAASVFFTCGGGVGTSRSVLCGYAMNCEDVKFLHLDVGSVVKACLKPLAVPLNTGKIAARAATKPANNMKKPTQRKT